MASQRIPPFFGSIPVRFDSAYSLEESIERLKAAVKPSIFQALFEEAAVGKVTECKVSLQRVLPMIGNSFKPFFKGSFRQEGDRVVLSGQFRLLNLIRVGLVIPFVFLAIGLVADLKVGRIEAIGGFGLMTVLWFAIAWVGQWFARNDVAWLSNKIATALAAARPGTIAETPVAPSQGFLVAFEILLGLGCIMSAASAVTGIREIHTGANGIEVTFHDTWEERLFVGLGAFAGALFLLGVYNRAKLAWKIGLWGLPIGGILAGARLVALIWEGPLVQNQPIAMRWFLSAFMTAGTAVVTVYWWLWWKKQEEHFHAIG